MLVEEKVEFNFKGYECSYERDYELYSGKPLFVVVISKDNFTSLDTTYSKNPSQFIRNMVNNDIRIEEMLKNK